MFDPVSSMRSRCRRSLLGPTVTCVALLLAAACSSGDGSQATGPSTSVGASSRPAAVGVVSGGGQTGTPGSALGQPLVVRVTTAIGTPVAGVPVDFQVSAGSGTLSTASAVTDANGQASTQLVLGASVGTVEVTASVRGTSLATTFSESVSPLTLPAVTCAAGQATTLAIGQAVSVSGTTVCVAGGTGSEYALVPFNGASDAKSRAALTVQATGIDPVSTSLADRLPAPNATRTDLRTAFEARLRARDAAVLTPLMPAARGWYAARTSPTVRRAVIPANVQVGSIVRLNANSNDPCSNPDYRGGVVMAVSQKAIVVADTLNPAGGYTPADYQSIAVTFDTLVDAVDTRNFGQPTDIDNNGHVVMFFTSAVNALTPRNSDSFIGGFFDSRDLFPTQTTNGLPGCATSNVGEMFYLLVPDPTGMVNGNRFPKSMVTTLTIATVAHEYQHLINASRRLYVNPAEPPFEETWLDEGLSHVAEELLFYARAHLTPGQDIDGTRLRSSTLVTNAFGDDGIENFDRLGEYLSNPLRNSPYAANDSLATRGATWSFLRFAADQVQPTGQEALWQRLVNSSATGLANLQQGFGVDLTGLFHDWALSLLLDDVLGADARYQMRSWNLRSVFEMPNVAGVYPLRTTSLVAGTPTAVAIPGGSAAYLRFAVGSGGVGSLSWSALPSNVQVTLVRLR